MSRAEREEGAGVLREREFDCVECGQHIIRLVSHEGELDLCGHCLYVPGWHRSHQLRKIIAPEGLPDMPSAERAPTEISSAASFLARQEGETPGAAVHAPKRQPGRLIAQLRFLRVLGRPFRRAPRILGK